MDKKIKNGIIALVVAIVLAAGVCCTGFASRGADGKWFGNSDLTTWHWSDKSGDNTPDDENGITAMAYSLSADEYEMYGVSPQAIEAKNIVVTFDPANTTDQRVEFGFAWENPNSEWASGKSVTDYIGYTPAADHGARCSVWAIKDYGETIICTVSSYANSALKDTVRLEHVKQFVGTEIELYMGNANTDNGFDFNSTFVKDSNFGTGTVKPTCRITAIGFAFDPDWEDDLRFHDNYIEFSLSSLTDHDVLLFDDLGSDDCQLSWNDVVRNYNHGFNPHLGTFGVSVDFSYNGEIVYSISVCRLEFNITQEFINFISIPANSISASDKVILV